MRTGKVFVAIFLLVAAVPAFGSDTFLHIPGIQGSSTDIRHRGWIDVTGVDLLIAPAVAEKPNSVRVQCSAAIAMPPSAVVVTALPFIGKPVNGPVTLEKQHPQTGQVYLRTVFEDVRISSYRTSSGDDIPTETVSFTFSTVEQTYTPQKADGSLDSPVKASYDCTQTEKK